jgi:diguanylate cyclase (GGDEF)-like protein/PAS domain S-box-containing protein
MPPATAPLAVLVIDDSADDRLVYRRYLSRAGADSFTVREAENAAAGLAAIAEAVPQLVLLDYQLPDSTGLDLLRQLRRSHPRLTVILLTGLEDVKLSVEVLRAGADDYQVKGQLTADSLLRAVRGALERRALETQMANERERLELFYRLVEASDDMLLVIRMPEAQIIEANQSALRQLQRSREALISPSLDLASVFPHAEEVWATLSDAAPVRRLDCEAIRADGVVLAIEVSANRVAINDRLYLVAVCRDASARKEMQAELQRLALLDGLTGIHNRRAFDERLAQEFGRAARGHGSLGLLMIDIDHFKAYNDHYGHPAGDRCLRQVAQALAATLKRPSDFLARYGGEEFGVLLPDASLADAAKVSSMLIERVRQLELPHAGSPGGTVSISVGASAATPPVRGQQDHFLSEVDKLLYAAKAAGRDRLMAADVPFLHDQA